MGSLLWRASQKRATAQRLLGVSAADQEEIRREIAKIAERNRLEITPELLSVKQGRSGVLFPVLVNVLAVVALVIGVVSFSTVFDGRRSQTAPARDAVLSSVEGEVLSELQQQMRAELEQRDAGMEAIQLQLAAVSRERDNIEAEIARRESEQRAALEQPLVVELRDERIRLEQMGLDVAEVNERLAEYEAARRAEIDHELTSYVAGLQNEREQLQAELTGLQTRLQDERDELARERDRIVAELQTVGQTANAEFDAALAEMAQLESDAHRRQQVDAQVVGLFTALREAVNDANFDAARREAANLRELLEEPRVRSVRGEQRLQIDLFIVDRLESMLEPSQVSSEPRMVDVLRQRITELAEQGNEEMEGGNIEAAESHYHSALAMVPQLLEGHQFLLERAVAEIEQELAAQIELAERQAAARESALEAELQLVRAAAQQAPLVVEVPIEVPVSRPTDVDREELERLRADAQRLAAIESQYASYRRERPAAQAESGSTTLLAERRLLDEVLSSGVIASTLPGVANDVARYQDAHFHAGREDAFSEVVDVLYAVSTLASSSERSSYLQRVLDSGDTDPVFLQLIEQLLQLIDGDQTAMR